jgi:hypothetical protein
LTNIASNQNVRPSQAYRAGAKGVPPSATPTNFCGVFSSSTTGLMQRGAGLMVTVTGGSSTINRFDCRQCGHRLCLVDGEYAYRLHQPCESDHQ